MNKAKNAKKTMQLATGFANGIFWDIDYGHNFKVEQTDLEDLDYSSLIAEASVINAQRVSTHNEEVFEEKMKAKHEHTSHYSDEQDS